MTKKDFELIAKTIRSLDLRTPPGCSGRDYHRKFVARGFAKALRSTNPRFDELRFIEACTGVVAPKLSKDVLVNGTPEEFTAASLDDLDRMTEEA